MLGEICSNEITVSFVVTTQTPRWTMTKYGSLILSEKPSAAAEHSLLLFSQWGTSFAGRRLMKCVPITRAGIVLWNTRVPFPSSPVICAGVRPLQLSSLLTRLSHGVNKSTNENRSLTSSRAHWTAGVHTNTHTHAEAHTLKNPLMRF